MMSNVAKHFDILATSLSVLRNNFDGPIELFLDLYISIIDKLLDILTKPFFPYNGNLSASIFNLRYATNR